MPLETITPATPAEPSFTELKAMLADPAPPVVEAPKPEAPAEIEKPESGTGTVADTKQPEQVEHETQDEKAEALPEGVKKRKAAEKAKQDLWDAEINREIALTKAKRDKLAELKAGNSGSEPAPTTAQPAEGAEPVEPDEFTFTGTQAEFNAAKVKYRAEYKTWLEGVTEKAVTARLAKSEAEARKKKEWDEAATKHGAEFPALMKTLAESIPPELQLEISGLADWAGVAVHLAKPANAAEREALAAKIKTAPRDAYYDLRVLELRLKKPDAKPADKPLPAPLTAVAGAANATGTVDLDKADRSYLDLKRVVEKALK